MYQKYLFKNCSISTEFHKDRRLINNDASSTDDISSPTFLKLQCQYRWQYCNKVSISYYHYFFCISLDNANNFGNNYLSALDRRGGKWHTDYWLRQKLL